MFQHDFQKEIGLENLVLNGFEIHEALHGSFFCDLPALLKRKRQNRADAQLI